MMKKMQESDVALPNMEKRRQELIYRHLEATKKLDRESLQRVYERDYGKLFARETERTTELQPRISQKRSFMSMPSRKMYRRFWFVCLRNGAK